VTAAAAIGSARLRDWAVLIVLLLAGFAVLAAVQMRGKDAGADFVEMHGAEPATLGGFFDAAGRPVSIGDFRGRTIVLNLWAPWCVPCLQEMPSLDRLAGRLRPEDFAVVAVTKDPVGASPSQATFDRMGLKRLALYLDPQGKLAADVGVRGFPTTLVIGRDGAPLAFREGATNWDSDAMVMRLEALAARGK